MPHFESSVGLRSIFSNEAGLLDEVRQIVATGKFGAAAARPGLKSELEAYLDPAKAAAGGAPFEATTVTSRRAGSRAKAAASGARQGNGVERVSANLEAIVLLIARPSLLVKDGTYVMPGTPTEVIPRATIDEIKAINRAKADVVIARSARVELVDIPGMPFLGTGWIVEKPKAKRAIVVTNRHVGLEFARYDDNGSYPFRLAPNFREYGVKIDFNEELGGTEPREVPVVRVLFIAGPRDPDIALLEIEGEAVAQLTAIELATAKPRQGDKIAVVGYPAYDSRNDPAAVAQYFGDIFNVKRYAFGDVTGISSNFPEFTHNATTLGGNSGSCVYDRVSGQAIGLHFAGEFRKGNYAVHADEIKKAMQGLTSTAVARPRSRPTEARGDGRNPTPHFKGRDGYNPNFLGKGKKGVEMPGFGSWADDIASVRDADTEQKADALKYRHFSVVMSASRKLPLITAVNINGAKAKRLGRVDTWFIDGRLGNDFQVDNDAYAGNPLDRGHMVRREDPVWGTLEEAEEANADTFHYTNCAPQHEALNQRDWLALEDYVLGNTRTKKLMVSVFTGPILKPDDPLYRNIVKLPRAFWKIAVIVNTDTNALSATGYILAQGELIRRLTEAFVFGAFRTYQVPLSLIQTEAGIDLSHLIAHDPLTEVRRREGAEGTTRNLFVPITSGADLLL